MALIGLLQSHLCFPSLLQPLGDSRSHMPRLRTPVRGETLSVSSVYSVCLRLDGASLIMHPTCDLERDKWWRLWGRSTESSKEREKWGLEGNSQGCEKKEVLCRLGAGFIPMAAAPLPPLSHWAPVWVSSSNRIDCLSHFGLLIPHWKSCLHALSPMKVPGWIFLWCLCCGKFVWTPRNREGF